MAFIKTIKQGKEFIPIYLTYVTKFTPIYSIKVKEFGHDIGLGCGLYY